jgi:hypothetical protein
MAVPVPERPTPGATVLAALRLLADHGEPARADVLRLALDAAPGLDTLVLRTAPGGAVVAAARRRTGGRAAEHGGHAPREGWALDVPVRRLGIPAGLLTATSRSGFTAADGELLRGLADALALAAGPAGAALPAAQVILDSEADRALVAAELDESVAEALVALRHVGAGRVDESASVALADVRRIARELRARALDEGLRRALAGLESRGARVQAEDPALDALAPAVAVLVQRVAEATCRAAVGSAQVNARVEDKTVKLWVESADNAIDASEVERWRRRARGLHGELTQRPWGVELTLPTGTGNAAGPDDEGRHDDRLDLRRPPPGP